MPRYEMALIYRCLERPELISAIKKTCDSILERGGILKTFENIGQRDLPYKMHNHGEKYTRGHFFVANFDSNPSVLVDLKSKLKEEPTVIRSRILREEEELFRPCDQGACDFGEMSDEMRRRLNQHLKECVKKL